MATRFIHLQGRTSSAVIEFTAQGVPVWRHWGARLGAVTSVPDWEDTAPVADFSLDKTVAPSALPLFGDGQFGPAVCLAHRAGKDWVFAPDFQVQHWGATTTLIATDAKAGLELRQSIEMDAKTDVLTLRTTLRNTGYAVLDVVWLASGALPLAPRASRVESFTGRYPREFVPDVQALGSATWRRENRRGLTSHDTPPLASVLGTGAGQHSGEVWSAQLAWSGNHVQSIDLLEDGTQLWMAGEWLAPGEVRLAPGGTLETPDWLATYSPNGRDGAARNFHAAVRARSPAPVLPRPVHLNTWEGVYFDHNEADLIDLARSAAGLGVERFVLDDGWFSGRRNDRAGLGDWWPDSNIYAEGLAPLAEAVIQLGMSFGLWIEPEMVNPDSDLYRAHPDWVLSLPGLDKRTARNQLVLDLTRPDVTEYLFERLDSLLAELPIAYLKWDHNRALTQAGDGSARPAYRQQVLANYRLLDRVRAAHPGVEIEACAAGGGRIDAGIALRTDRFWTSDNIDARDRAQIQRGFLQFFPPDRMGAHVGASPAHLTGRSQSLAFRAGVALPGHFGLELDPRQLSADLRYELRKWIALYKSQRDRLHTGDVWRGDVGDSVHWQAHGDEREFIVFVYRLELSRYAYPPALQLPFLDDTRVYRLSRLDPGAPFQRGQAPEAHCALQEGTLDISGAWLKTVGLALPQMKAETCLIIEGTVAEVGSTGRVGEGR
ncbi:MAG: alpha-galactosidase [Pseudomonadota bacterium]